MTEKSWPYELQLELERLGIKCDVICSATCGNLSFNELLRLVRDLLNLKIKPNIIISYSGCNEGSILSVPQNRNVHYYQKKLFEKIQNNANYFFGLKSKRECLFGVQPQDFPENWLRNERCMHAVCAEFGITFYAIFQPTIYSKEPRTNFDQELFLHNNDWDERAEERYQKAKQKLNTSFKKYNWLYDFSDIFNEVFDPVYFDYYHILESANSVIVKNILLRTDILDKLTN